MICVKCGQQNPPGLNYCGRCGMVLPKMPQAAHEEAPAQQVNERYLQIREACERAMNGETPLEDFARFLDHIARVLTQKEQEIRDIEIPAEALDDFQEELEVGFTGIQLYNQGIAIIRLYLEDGEPAHVEEGLELVREGNELINDAMRINRDNRRKLEETYIDTSTMI